MARITGTFEPNENANGGWLRSPDNSYQVTNSDPCVPPPLCKALNLRGGETVVASCASEAGKSASRAPTVESVESINEMPTDAYLELKPLESLTAIDPKRAIQFEIDGGPLSMRVVDLMTPIGFGQRGLLVAPPRTGKTILLQQMAGGVAANHPHAYVIMLLVDERPEEVTEMRRTVHGEVVASSNDQNIASHVRIARLIIEKAKRLVECRRDVVVFLDSLTRLGRAFNARLQSGGRIMSGGLDIRALAEPKSIFGAARNVEEGGSLTIIATCLIDTGSRMDEVIFNEFKGTGNMEIMLCRDLANRRIWPAIDLNLSGTRKEERLLSPQALEVSHRIRRTLLDKDPAYPMEILLEQMGKCRNNREFIARFGETVFR